MSAIKNKIHFHDFQPLPESFREAVFDGLSRKQKRIPPKFFYNEKGSALLKAFWHNRNTIYRKRKRPFSRITAMSLPN